MKDINSNDVWLNVYCAAINSGNAALLARHTSVSEDDITDRAERMANEAVVRFLRRAGHSSGR